MNCLDNIVSYRGACEAVTPTSGLYLDDLPFIDLATLDQIAKGNGQELIDRQLALSQKQIVQDIYTEFQAKVTNGSIMENEVAGYFQDNLQAQAAEAGQLKGIQVKLTKYPYLEFFLGSITLQLATSGAQNVLVYDLISGTLLDTLAITTVANVPTQLTVNKSYKTKKQMLNIAIVYSSATATYKSYLKRGAGCVSCAGGDSYTNNYAYFNGIKIASASQKIQSNVMGAGGTSGLSISYSIRCSPDELICNYAGALGMPLLYKWAANLMMTGEYTNRFNSVSQKKADMSELKDYLQSMYISYMFGGTGADGHTREGIIPAMKINESMCSCKNRNGWAVRVP